MIDDWSSVRHAGGPAVEVPGWLHDLTAEDYAARAALRDLWGSVWQQGTVYTCTPVVVPFLADVVGDDSAQPAVRAEVAVLLASIGAAARFVVDDGPTVTATHRGGGVGRDLAEECRLAVAAELDRLGFALRRGPPAVRAGLVAVCASAVDSLPASARAGLHAMQQAGDPGLADAARRVVLLADDADRRTGDVLGRRAEVEAVHGLCLLAIARALPG